MVKIVQAFVFIGKDRSMYHPDTDTPAMARTSNLNEVRGRRRRRRRRGAACW
jgi:phospholipid-transporting ATPase